MSDPQPSSPSQGSPGYDAYAAEDKGPAIMITCWLFIGISTLFVASRVWVRIWGYQKLLADDYWCISGLICAYIGTALVSVAVPYGNGKHYDTLSISDQENVRLWTLAAFCPGVMCFGLPKMAVVHLLTRLLNPSKKHRYFLWAMVIWCQLTLFATVGTLLGQCQPTKMMWNFDMKGKCVNPDHIINFSLYAGAYSAFVDIYLAVYPTIVLYKLQLKLRKKIALCFALGVGLVSGSVAIYKTTRIPSGLASPDFSYDSSDLMIWTIIEGSTIIIACTIPVLSPLMDLLFRGRNPFRSTDPQSYPTNKDNHFSTRFTNSRHTRQDTLHDLEASTVANDSSQDDITLPKMSSNEEKQEPIGAGVTRPSVASVPPVQQPVADNQILCTNEVSVSFADTNEQQQQPPPVIGVAR